MTSKVNYTRLKTNLSLAIERLKLLEKKKTEAVQKSRKEIAEYIQNDKVERAKIRVEHIIREDYLIEAMEIVEMFCDLLLTRFGMIQQMKTLDDGLEEAIASLIWVAPRMSTDVKELKTIADIFTQKYGKKFAQASKDNLLKSVNEKLMLKLGVQAPPKILIEKYLIEISKTLGVAYEPDEEVLLEDKKYTGGDNSGGSQNDRTPMPGFLIDLNDPKSSYGQNEPPPLPKMPPSFGPLGNESDYLKRELSGEKPPEIGFIGLPPSISLHSAESKVPPSYESVVNPSISSEEKEVIKSKSVSDNLPSVPLLPEVPNDDDFVINSGPGDSKPINNFDDNFGTKANQDIDFDDLRRRFENLKKRN